MVPAFMEKWESPAAINMGPRIGHVAIQFPIAPGKALFKASMPDNESSLKGFA